MRFGHRRSIGIIAGLVLFFGVATTTRAYVLVADRVTNRVLRYTNGGQFVGEIVNDPANLGGLGNASGPNGLALSPDGTKLYVSSLNGSVVRYDFNGTSGTNPQKYTSNGASTISDPGGVLVSPNGSTVYVSSRGFGFSNAVARLNPNGVSLGANLTGGSATGRTGMDFGPTGVLLVGTFGTDFMGGGPGGGVLRFDAGAGQFVDLIPATPALAGASSILVHGNDLYVAAAVSQDFQGRVGKFNATTGAANATFGTGGLVTPQISFPASMTESGDGTGFLLGMLHLTQTGAGRVDRYLFDGTRVGVWANNSFANPALGFAEATALLQVPEPGTAVVAAIGMAVLAVRGRASRRR